MKQIFKIFALEFKRFFLSQNKNQTGWSSKEASGRAVLSFFPSRAPQRLLRSEREREHHFSRSHRALYHMPIFRQQIPYSWNTLMSKTQLTVFVGLGFSIIKFLVSAQKKGGFFFCEKARMRTFSVRIFLHHCQSDPRNCNLLLERRPHTHISRRCNCNNEKLLFLFKQL